MISNAGIVPCGRNADDPNTPNIIESGMCTLCDLIKGIWIIVDYAMKILVVVALLMIVIAGTMYIVSAGNQGLMNTAKHLLWSVLIGFAIVLVAWLGIRTIIFVIGVNDASFIRATGDKPNWFDFDSWLTCPATSIIPPTNPSGG